MKKLKTYIPILIVIAGIFIYTSYNIPLQIEKFKLSKSSTDTNIEEYSKLEKVTLENFDIEVLSSNIIDLSEVKKLDREILKDDKMLVSIDVKLNIYEENNYNVEYTSPYIIGDNSVFYELVDDISLEEVLKESGYNIGNKYIFNSSLKGNHINSFLFLVDKSCRSLSLSFSEIISNNFSIKNINRTIQIKVR